MDSPGEVNNTLTDQIRTEDFRDVNLKVKCFGQQSKWSKRSESFAHSEKVHSDVGLEFAHSLFFVPCYSNMVGTPNKFVVPTQKKASVHPGKPFTEKAVTMIHISKS